jgi:peptidoglycan hydrolase-like protein with peptidoglycan-binding domain
MNKKIIASVLAVTFALSAIAVPVTNGATVEELEAQIAQLTALITSLQAQLAGQTSTPATGAVCFYTDLEHGMTSAEVLKLQQTLNLDPATRIAASGAGAPGSETTYFGSLTLAAVKAFQAKHGIITTGYVGPLTRAQLNALYCTPTTTTTVPDGTTTTTTVPDGTTTTTTVAGATEGTLTVTQNPLPGSGTVTLYGGNTNKEVAAYKVKATNSDIRVKRVNLQIGITNDFPWRAISSISVWDGSTMLKEVAATQANFSEVTYATTYTMQLDGLDVLVAKDTEKVLSIKATAVSVPQYANTISVLIPANGVRGIDSLGLNVYGPATALSAHNFTTATAQSPVITTTAAIDSPTTGNFIASASAVTRVDLMKINLKVENVDMTFKGGTINVTTNGNTTMSAVELYDGSTLLATAATTTTGVVTLSAFTLPVSADTTKVLTVKGVVKANPTSGSGVAVSLPNTTGLVGYDANGASQGNSGAITGDTLTVYTAAPVFALSSASSVRSDSSSSTVSDVGDFTIGVSITANSGDIYIPTVGHATYGSAQAAPGIMQSVTTNGTESASGSNWICDSSAVEDSTNKVWRIPSGATAVCTYTYHTVNTTTASYYNVSILNIKWSTTANMASTTTQTTGLSSLKAPALWLQI